MDGKQRFKRKLMKLQLNFLKVQTTGVVKTGGYRYEDSTRYIGDWNQKGQKHGMGHLLIPDGTRYGKIQHLKCKMREELKNCTHRWLIQQRLMQWLGSYEFSWRIKVKICCISVVEYLHLNLSCLSLSRCRYEGELMQGWFHGKLHYLIFKVSLHRIVFFWNF